MAITESFSNFSLKSLSFTNYFFTLQVFTPISLYSGQKLTKAVSNSIPPTNNKTAPKVPEIIPVMYKVEVIAAINIRMTLSNFPTFDFM